MARNFIVGAGAACAMLLAGCATSSGGASGAADSVLEYQRQVALLEVRIALYEGAVGDAVGELGELARSAGDLGGTVDEIIGLFDEYQRRVDKLLRLYSEAREQGEVTGQDSPGTGDSVWGDDFGEDSGVHPVHLRD